MTAPAPILALVERFGRNVDAYRSGQYNETQLRREFLDPFWEALGWDVNNRQGWAEAYKEVVHEDAIKVGGASKAPDYGFRIGGTRKFFVEAKKPLVNIKHDIHPAFQLRRYAWSAKLPLSVLSDFEEFAVYDCRVKPERSDAASKARILYLRYTDYAERWEEIAGVFAKDSILQGSFDRYAESNRRKRGTTEVDDAFLREIESWRESLAQNLALRNRDLSQRELNFAVGRTIDRIIFLRICEDRGIEEYGRLQALLNGANVYARLLELFARADERYNSGLFHFRPEKDHSQAPDTLTPSLAIDDRVLKEILKRLYYPESPYEFSVLPADILGQVYEQFLGKVIRLTAGHRAVVEDKPEVRKAGGVYYTPTYIVDYIVRQTVGRLVEGKRPGPRGGVSKLRILDPACGSGSFLLGAYQFLLDWHLREYVADGPDRHLDVLHQTRAGEWRLSTAERKRILLNNIYGVDIDAQATETTKLSLLLKVLEGETEETLGRQLALFHARALPDLGSNIKSGNSLIGLDFYDGEQIGMLDEEERYRVNAFDWDAEFPEIMRGGGFDAVIGNPPYLGGREWKQENGREYDYFLSKFTAAEYQFDIYTLFWERGIQLMKPGGTIGFITPNTWLNNKSNTKLRKLFLEKTELVSITDYSRVRVFRDATVLPVVTVARRAAGTANSVNIYSPSEEGAPELSHTIPQVVWSDDEYRIFNIAVHEEDVALRAKIEGGAVPLEDLAQVKFGIKLYETGKGSPPQKRSDAKERIFESQAQLDPDYRPYLEGKDVDRYAVSWQQRWLKYGPNLAAPRDPALFRGERLLLRRIVGNRLIGTYTHGDYVTSQLLQIVKPNENGSAKYLLGILNSSLIAYYFRKKYNRQDKTFPEIRIYELASMPIREPGPADAARHDRMVALVEQMLLLREQLASTSTAHDKTLIERQIRTTDRQIDRLVYELYGLTEEEIGIVEGSSN